MATNAPRTVFPLDFNRDPRNMPVLLQSRLLLLLHVAPAVDSFRSKGISRDSHMHKRKRTIACWLRRP